MSTYVYDLSETWSVPHLQFKLWWHLKGCILATGEKKYNGVSIKLLHLLNQSKNQMVHGLFIVPSSNPTSSFSYRVCLLETKKHFVIFSLGMAHGQFATPMGHGLESKG